MSEKEKKCNCGCDEHGHDDCCDCGCEEDVIELVTEDGKKLKFYEVGNIEYKGKLYAAFEPAEQIDGMEDDDLVIFEVVENGEDETVDLLPIEDDKLLDEVFEEFCRVFEEDELAEEAESLEPTDDNK